MTITQEGLNNEDVFNMSWLFFFIFSVASIKSLVLYFKLSRVGQETEELLITSLIYILCACVAYEKGVKDISGNINIKEVNVIQAQ